MKIVTARKILEANELAAQRNRNRFHAAGVFCINLLGSPGSGKTTLLEALLRHLDGPLAPGVIEGDIAGSVDAERIEALGVPVVQINTQGACHLDAGMVEAAVADLHLQRLDLLLIENVGNLVCTAGFDLGEQLRIIVLSTSEGHDKLIKYPAIFRGSQAVVVSKMDLLPHTDFDPRRVAEGLRVLSPEAAVFHVSAVREEGVAELARWLAARASARSD